MTLKNKTHKVISTPPEIAAILSDIGIWFHLMG